MTRRPGPDDRTERAEARRAARETEASLVSALQDSDTPAELIQDELDHVAETELPSDTAGRLPLHRLLAAIALAVLGLLVARRRR
jgi:hypothetical protein